MKFKINKELFEYLLLIILFMLELGALVLISTNTFLFVTYFIINTIIFSIYCYKSNIQQCIHFFILFFLIFIFGIEICIHYLNKIIFLEAKYMYILPLIIVSVKNKNIKQSKILYIFILFFLFNFVILLLNSTSLSSIKYFFEIVHPMIIGIMLFYIFKNNNINVINLYKNIYILSIILTTVQTLLGFNSDTRNSVFGVFGLGSYSFFIICYPIYVYSRWLRNNKNTLELFFSIISSLYLLVCIENKAFIGILFILLAIIPILSKKKSFKYLIISLAFFLMIPFAYKTLITFYPKFAYLININELSNYFFGNNNWAYKYGRFESLKIVLDDTSLEAKIFGKGFGSSTPMDEVFLNELGRKVYQPYYIQKYGQYHGFQLTSISTTILDGGYIFLLLIIMLFLKILKKSIVYLKSKKNDYFIKGSIMLSVLFGIIYYYCYNNIIISYKLIYIICIILGICFNSEQLEMKNGEGNER